MLRASTRRLPAASSRWKAASFCAAPTAPDSPSDAYDHSRELVIDPVLTFSTYFGGSGDELATSVAVDGRLQYLPHRFDHLAQSSTSGRMRVSDHARPGATQNVYIAKITPPLGVPKRRSGLRDLSGRRRNRHSGRNQRGRRGRSVRRGHDFSDNFPTTATNAYQTTPEVPGTHVFVTEMLAAAPAAVFFLSFGQRHGHRQRNDD